MKPSLTRIDLFIKNIVFLWTLILRFHVLPNLLWNFQTKDHFYQDLCPEMLCEAANDALVLIPS
jgi:hypothetical protein